MRGKGRAGHDFVGACRPCRGDKVGLHMGDVPDGPNGCQIVVFFHLRNRREGICLRTVQVEDAELRFQRTRLLQGFLRRAHEHEFYARLFRGRANLGAEEQIVYGYEHHTVILHCQT